MNEVKSTFKRIAIYYGLLAINIIPCASVLPDRFPTRNVSTIYLLVFCAGLILYYSHRVLRTGGISVMMKALSWMALLLILLRGIKYSVFAQVDILARHTWYLYYVPMLLLPLLLFCISLMVSPKEPLRFPKRWFWIPAITVVLIALVLTNDYHQLVFRFAPQFLNWDNDYTHGWLFYVITFWQYALYLAGIVILVIKCRIGSAKRNAWIMLIPFALGVLMSVLLITDKMPRLNGSHIVEFPEALIFTVAIELECCMQLGLIPTNTDYGKLFRAFSLSAQITDQKGTPIYSSYTAKKLTPAQFALPNGARMGTHTVLHKMKLPGGFGLWVDDMTELDRLNAELALAKEELAQESELIRLRSELKEKETKIEQRTLLYDAIAQRTQRQSQAISRLAGEARLSHDAAIKERNRREITLLGAYIKRYANLKLLSGEKEMVEVGELGLSVSEVLRYLNYCGIPGELLNNAEGTIASAAALTVFESFETLLEADPEHLRGVFVNLSMQGNAIAFKVTLENFTAPTAREMIEALRAVDILCEESREDDVAYFCFTLPRGGEAA